uniref:Putative secreted protein n=1 Tax=Ixodes ricinus TaxID=34613 RepID=A0A6B0UYN4_IXORI
MSTQSSLQMALAWSCLWQGLSWRVQATAFQASGGQVDTLRTGMSMTGRRIRPWDQRRTSASAVLSERALQLWNSSAGRRLKWVQYDRSSQPSSHGSSTSARQFCMSTSAGWYWHLVWKVSQEDAQSVPYVLRQSLWHSIVVARRQHCILAPSLGRKVFVDTGSLGLELYRKHCQSLS